MPLKEFTLTYVTYEQDDPFGKTMALLTLSPIFIMVMYATLIVFRRDFHTISLVFGQLFNEVINLALKNIMQQPRPQGSKMRGHGMPSAHSQFMMFFAVYIMLFIAKRARNKRMHEKILAGVGAHFLAILVCYSRYHLGYHTIEQVAIGSIVGSASGILWFTFVNNTLSKYFPALEEMEISKFFLLRDYSHVMDLTSFEYDCSRQMRETLKQS